MVQLVLRPSGELEVLGAEGRPLFALRLLEPARGKVRPLRQPAAGKLPPGHYRVASWTRGDGAEPARLGLADLDIAAEARLVDAGRARRSPDGELLEVDGIRGRTGGLRGGSGPTIHAAAAGGEGAAAGGIAVRRDDLLRLVDLLQSDPSHGIVVLTVVEGPYPLN